MLPRSSALAPAAALALAGALALIPAWPAQGAARGWCTRIPLASSCRPVMIRTANATLRLALASTDAQRERGLMNVAFVPPSQGMIFVFPDGDNTRDFWMKNTITPLDMVFVRGDGTVSDVAVNVPATTPATPDDRIPHRTGIGRYVIELGAGQAGPAGILPGTRLTIPPLSGR